MSEWEGFKDESQSEIGKGAVRSVTKMRVEQLPRALWTRAHMRWCVHPASACMYLVGSPKSRSWLQLDLTVLSLPLFLSLYSCSSRCTQDGHIGLAL